MDTKMSISGLNCSIDFDSVFQRYGEGKFYKNCIGEIERPLIEWSLKKAWGNQFRAAKILGLNRNTIRAKIKRLGIEPGMYK